MYTPSFNSSEGVTFALRCHLCGCGSHHQGLPRSRTPLSAHSSDARRHLPLRRPRSPSHRRSSSSGGVSASRRGRSRTRSRTRSPSSGRCRDHRRHEVGDTGCSADGRRIRRRHEEPYERRRACDGKDPGAGVASISSVVPPPSGHAPRGGSESGSHPPRVPCDGADVHGRVNHDEHSHRRVVTRSPSRGLPVDAPPSPISACDVTADSPSPPPPPPLDTMVCGGFPRRALLACVSSASLLSGKMIAERVCAGRVSHRTSVPGRRHCCFC